MPLRREPGERREQRQPDWSSASLIHLESPDDIHSKFNRAKIVNAEQWQLLFDAISQADAPAQAKLLHNLKDQLVQYKDLLLAPPTTQPNLPDRWATQFPTADVSSRSLNLYDHLDGLVDNLDKPFVLTTSSTHRSTAQVFDAIERNLDYETGQRAILSFDHHSDLDGIDDPVKELDTPSKSNVMAYLLKKRRVEAVAVFGAADLFKPDHGAKHDVILGSALHTEAGPQRQLFLDQLRGVLQKWKDSGIRQVYTSVDLDALRLPTQTYSGTDYNPIDRIRNLLLEPNMPEALQRYLAFDQHGYRGIPAAWIPLAMQVARTEFGLKLGVQKHVAGHKPDQGLETKIVGDVVEYVGPDLEGRTAKIAQGILGSMLAEAQAK